MTDNSSRTEHLVLMSESDEESQENIASEEELEESVAPVAQRLPPLRVKIRFDAPSPAPTTSSSKPSKRKSKKRSKSASNENLEFDDDDDYDAKRGSGMDTGSETDTTVDKMCTPPASDVESVSCSASRAETQHKKQRRDRARDKQQEAISSTIEKLLVARKSKKGSGSSGAKESAVMAGASLAERKPRGDVIRYVSSSKLQSTVLLLPIGFDVAKLFQVPNDVN